MRRTVTNPIELIGCVLMEIGFGFLTVGSFVAAVITPDHMIPGWIIGLGMLFAVMGLGIALYSIRPKKNKATSPT